jgi:hypothetical protein
MKRTWSWYCGNKVTETIFTGSRMFIRLADSGEIISPSSGPLSVSGAGLNTHRVCPPPPYRIWSQFTGDTAELAGGLQFCRASRKLLVDSEWENQGKFQIHSKSQEHDRAGSNNGEQSF